MKSYYRMIFKKETFGRKSYKCAIISCIHPLEDAGLRIFDLLKKHCSQMNFTLITAINRKKIASSKYNLNRLFNIPNSNYFSLISNKKEYLLINELHKEIAKYDLVIDIHSTNFKHPPYFIVVNLTPLVEKMIMVSNICNVLILNYKNSLIATAKNAIAIEIGENNNIKDIINGFRNLELIISNLERENIKKRKLRYFVSIGELRRDFINRLSRNVKDFKLVKRNDLLGYKKNKKIYSPLNFYPLWVEKLTVDKNYPVVCHFLEKIKEGCFFETH